MEIERNHLYTIASYLLHRNPDHTLDLPLPPALLIQVTRHNLSSVEAGQLMSHSSLWQLVQPENYSWVDLPEIEAPLLMDSQG